MVAQLRGAWLRIREALEMAHEDNQSLAVPRGTSFPAQPVHGMCVPSVCFDG